MSNQNSSIKALPVAICIFLAAHTGVTSSDSVTARPCPIAVQKYTPCKYSQIPIEAGSLAYARFEDQVIIAERIFWGAVKFENLGSKPVMRITAMIDYFDSNDHRIFSVVYYAEPETDVNRDDSTPPTESPEGLKGPVDPGQAHLLSTVSWMTTSQCPKYAKLELLSLEYTDHTAIHWEEKEWISNPVLDDSPQYFPLPCGRLTPGYSRHIAVKVDATGQVKDFSSDEPIDSKSRTCLLGQLLQWRYHPALRNGRPVEATIPILLRVQPPNTDWHSVSAAELTHPLVIVDIFPEPDVPEKWRVWYGDRPASRVAVTAQFKK